MTRAEQAEKTSTELQAEHQAACDLVHSKEQLVELRQAEINQLRESLEQATAQQEEQNLRWELVVSSSFCYDFFLFQYNGQLFQN